MQLFKRCWPRPPRIDPSMKTIRLSGLLILACSLLVPSFAQIEVINDGNIGIGTATPGTRKLNIFTASSTNDVGVEIFQARATGANYGLIVSAVGSGATLNQGVLTTAGNGSSNFGLRIWNVAAAAGNYALYSDSAAQSYFQGSVGTNNSSRATAMRRRAIAAVWAGAICNWATTVRTGL